MVTIRFVQSQKWFIGGVSTNIVSAYIMHQIDIIWIWQSNVCDMDMHLYYQVAINVHITANNNNNHLHGPELRTRDCD